MKKIKELELGDYVWCWETLSRKFVKGLILGNNEEFFAVKIIGNDIVMKNYYAHNSSVNEYVFSINNTKNIFDIDIVYYSTDKEQIKNAVIHDQDVLYCGIKNLKYKFEDEE